MPTEFASSELQRSLSEIPWGYRSYTLLPDAPANPGDARVEIRLLDGDHELVTASCGDRGWTLVHWSTGNALVRPPCRPAFPCYRERERADIRVCSAARAAVRHARRPHVGRLARFRETPHRKASRKPRRCGRHLLAAETEMGVPRLRRPEKFSSAARHAFTFSRHATKEFVLALPPSGMDTRSNRSGANEDRKTSFAVPDLRGPPREDAAALTFQGQGTPQKRFQGRSNRWGLLSRVDKTRV